MASSSPDLVLCHFNDSYHIEQEGAHEPVGGAARFATKVKEIRAGSACPVVVTCGGDVFNPSLMSIAFKGKQMVPVLNALDVRYAVVGNHDFDNGEDLLEKLVKATPQCSWLLSNCFAKASGKPLVSSVESVLHEWNGIKVGVFAVIEPGWMATLTCDTENFDYRDYIEVANAMAASLRTRGAELVLCLTHMRLPEDQELCRKSRGIDIVLGGHDHFYHCEVLNGVTLVKSGMDFRYLTKVAIKRVEGSRLFSISHEEVQITSAIAPDPEILKIVEGFQSHLEGQLSKVIGETTTEIDARASKLRTEETAIGNFVCDMLMNEYGADCCIMNSGTVRSDNVYEPGPISMKTLLLMFPFEDIMVVVKVSGENILKGLENGVSKWPAHEGRFPQVGGIRFAFDPRLPAGSRVKRDSVTIKGQPIDSERVYTMATKPYMLEGKDGYDCFKGMPFVIDRDNGQLLSLMLRNHFRKLHIAAAVRHAVRSPQEIARDKLLALTRSSSGDTKKKDVPIIAPTKDGRIVNLAEGQH